MTAREHFQAGRLNEALQALGAEVRDNPTDTRRRTFLFELLCFAGEYDRARKHLELLAKDNQQAGMAALLYEACMHSERTRLEIFEKKDFPVSSGSGKPCKGTLNGQAFEDIRDADPRVGPRLEVFSAGAYLWIPFEHIESIEMEAPKKLRDLLWIHALVKTGPGFKQMELGECLLPVLCPHSFKHADGNVRLGRVTVWEEVDGQDIPFGQRMLLVDGEEFPLLEVRKIEFPAAEVEGTEAAS